MSKFDDIFGQAKKEPTNLMFIEIDGTFACMTCDEYVGVGKWYQMERVLIWECSSNHKSMIENFG